MPDPDPLALEPTDAEIAAVAEQEAKEARDLAKKTAPKKAPAGRGPGRPPGAKNKTTIAKEAASRGASTTTSSAAPKSTPPARTAPASELEKAARDRAKDARDRRIAELIREADKHTFTFVGAVGMVTGLPGQYLMTPEKDARGNQLVDNLNQPVLSLTPYGQALAPKPWQVKTCLEAYVRAEETDAGQKLLAQFDKAMPYLLMLGAVAALGTYTVSTMQVAGALKEMIAAEIAQQAAATSGSPDSPEASGGAAG